MRKLILFILIVIILCVLLTSCDHVSKSNQRIETISSYHVENASFQVQEPSSFDQNNVYLIEDEIELARLIQSHYDNGEDSVVFQCDHELNLETVNEILSHINPFDIQLSQTTNEYRNQNQEVVYRSFTIQMINLDLGYEDALQKVQDTILKLIHRDMEDSEKIQAVHDYLIAHIQYDNQAATDKAGNQDAFSASGALSQGKSVCAGYARSFMMFMEALDIPCIYVSSQSMDHSWNYVKVNGTWKFVDVTWDDHDDTEVYYDYFNLDFDAFFEDGKHWMDEQHGLDFYENLTRCFF